MAQIRQQNSALRSRYAQAAAAQTATAVNARVACEQLEQLNRKLEAAHAEIRRYQTRLFACERQMNALRMENAELESACEQVREEALQAKARAEELEQQLTGILLPPETELPEPDPLPEEPAAQRTEPAAAEKAESTRQKQEAGQTAAEQPPAGPEWQPKTELEHLSVELMNWFDQMMDAGTGAV